MRYLLITLLSVLFITGIYSCSEDFTVSAPYRDITVVSGIINQADAAHYIRIQKAFMDENNSAITMAQEADSSFYQNITVELQEYNPTQTQLITTIPLERVDLNTESESYKKDDPINEQQFFTTPNYGYKFVRTDLDADNWYRLLIKNNNTGRIDSSEFVGMVNSDTIRDGKGFFIPDFRFNDLQISFAKISNPAFNYKLVGYLPKNARMVEGHIRFHYVSKNILTGTSTRQSVDFLFDTETANLAEGKSFELAVANIDIYNFLSSAIGEAPENTDRFLDSCDIFVYAGGPELYYYNTVNLGQSSGLTGDNIQPTYSNFTTGDVLGVVSSRAMRAYRGVAIDPVTIDSMIKNPMLSHLRLRGATED